MKKILIMAVICLPILFGSCEKRVINTDVTIYGNVYDATTFNPIQGAVVKIQPNTQDRVTGGDGTYQFDNLDASSTTQYTIYVSASGYQADSKTTKISAGESYNVSFALKKL